MSRSLPRRAKLRRSLAATALAVGLLASGSARAQSAAAKAEAQALFEEGRKLMKEGKLEEACKAFEGSNKADPAIGTLLNLANCYEQAGKTASAWALYEEVATKARRAEQPERVKVARERADGLVDKLSKLTVKVAEPVDGMTVTVNGVGLASTLWGKSAPTDPGDLTVVAEAPGKDPWTGNVTLGEDADVKTLEVPPLADAPEDSEPKAVIGPTSSTGGDTGGDDGTKMAMEVSGWTMLGVGVAGGAAGVILRVLALGKSDDSYDFCSPDDPENVCTQEGQDLRDQAQALQTGSLIAWIAGGALAVGGVVLVVTAPSGSEAGDEEAAMRVEWLANAGPGYGTVGMRMRW
jgi:hypothetical protein